MVKLLLVTVVKLDSKVFGKKNKTNSLSVILNSRKIVKWDNETANKNVT